jgi:hypothetical protein
MSRSSSFTTSLDELPVLLRELADASERVDAAASALPEDTEEQRQVRTSARIVTVSVAALAPSLRELARVLEGR